MKNVLFFLVVVVLFASFTFPVYAMAQEIDVPKISAKIEPGDRLIVSWEVWGNFPFDKAPMNHIRGKKRYLLIRDDIDPKDSYLKRDTSSFVKSSTEWSGDEKIILPSGQDIYCSGVKIFVLGPLSKKYKRGYKYEEILKAETKKGCLTEY
jgi:hypothetical protein